VDDQDGSQLLVTFCFQYFKAHESNALKTFRSSNVNKLTNDHLSSLCRLPNFSWHFLNLLMNRTVDESVESRSAFMMQVEVTRNSSPRSRKWTNRTEDRSRFMACNWPTLTKI